MTKLNTERIEALLEELTRPVCDALVVVSDDVALIDWNSGRVGGPIDIKSITKSVVSMLIGRLFREGMIDDLDVPISTLLPAWRGTPKERITLRHVMSHISGLDPSPSSEDAFTSGNVVEFALELELVSEPGTRFAYNNSAVNLLSSVVEAIAGRPLDQVAEELLFEPIGIRSWDWQRDAVGTPLAMSGCLLEPRDLALLGQVMVHAGTWHGRELLTPEWCRVSTEPAPPTSAHDVQYFLRSYSLLWWVLYPLDESFIIDNEVIRAWKEADPPLDTAVLDCMESLDGRTYHKDDLILAATKAFSTLTAGDKDAALTKWHNNTWLRGLPDGRRAPHSDIGFYAQGAMGQHLLVEPKRKLVVVQLVDEATVPAGTHELLEAAMAVLP